VELVSSFSALGAKPLLIKATNPDSPPMLTPADTMYSPAPTATTRYKERGTHGCLRS